MLAALTEVHHFLTKAACTWRRISLQCSQFTKHAYWSQCHGTQEQQECRIKLMWTLDHWVLECPVFQQHWWYTQCTGASPRVREIPPWDQYQGGARLPHHKADSSWMYSTCQWPIIWVPRPCCRHNHQPHSAPFWTHTQKVQKQQLTMDIWGETEWTIHCRKWDTNVHAEDALVPKRTGIKNRERHWNFTQTIHKGESIALLCPQL